MIELSFAKLFLVALIALVVLGPEKLPGAARTAGVLIRRLRASWDGVRAEVARELAVEDVRATARAAEAAVVATAATLSAAQAAFRDDVRRMHQSLIQAASAPAASAPPATAAAIEAHADEHA